MNLNFSINSLSVTGGEEGEDGEDGDDGGPGGDHGPRVTSGGRLGETHQVDSSEAAL